jgi:hypothetical protein
MTDTIGSVTDPTKGTTSEHRSQARVNRPKVALALASVALLAAVLGAFGPASKVRTTYSWPPSPLPAGTPSRVWYTPLLLIRHQPEALSATLPCSLPPALPRGAKPFTILATARSPQSFDGLAVTSSGHQLLISVGSTALARAALIPGPSHRGKCVYRLRFEKGEWSLEGGPNEITQHGALATMPSVSGLLSAVDLRSQLAPSIDVTTTVHATRAITRQTMSWTAAAVLAMSALLLVAFERRPRSPWAVVGRRVRSAAANSHPADAAIAGVLLGWWLIAPAVYDDGWVTARLTNYPASGGFSAYYNSFGSNQPLGYWLEWTQHWLTQASQALLVLRLPALFCLAATWVLCRWIVSRSHGAAIG